MVGVITIITSIFFRTLLQRVSHFYTIQVEPNCLIAGISVAGLVIFVIIILVFWVQGKEKRNYWLKMMLTGCLVSWIGSVLVGIGVCVYVLVFDDQVVSGTASAFSILGIEFSKQCWTNDQMLKLGQAYVIVKYGHRVLSLINLAGIVSESSNNADMLFYKLGQVCTVKQEEINTWKFFF